MFPHTFTDSSSNGGHPLSANAVLLRHCRRPTFPRQRSLKHQWFSSHRTLLPPLGFFLALLVGGALARGNLVQGTPFRFHPHVGVTREHGARDVPGDAHDHLVARARLGGLRDQRVPVIVVG